MSGAEASAATGMASPRRSPRRFSVMEMFGPTIQGEGPDAGRPCQFIRFGGCDYRCSWCDSMLAVEPALVKANAERLTTEEIMERVKPDIKRVILSGGNPALWELHSLVEQLRRAKHLVSVETQGSRWRNWLAQVDRLVISPKPPSSGMLDWDRASAFGAFMDQVREAKRRRGRGLKSCLKIVVFNEADYVWAKAIHLSYPNQPFYLSAGTPQIVEAAPDLISQGEQEATVIDQVRRNFRWIAEKADGDPQMQDVVILPQLHVIAWGTVAGV